MQAHQLPPQSSIGGEASSCVIRSAELLVGAILSVPHEGDGAALLQHKKTLLARVYSFVTDSTGKYSSPCRSQGVLDAIANGDDVEVEHEHVYSRISVTNELLKDPTRIRELLTSRMVSCLVTPDEHRELGRVERQMKLNGWPRYEEANVLVPGRVPASKGGDA